MINIQPKVSIIMNCYNSSQFLREAIECVLEQTYKNWELIFWDNQSTDESATIFKEYKDERLMYNYASSKTDLSEARNLAISKAKGEWFAFLDCDDVWRKEKLELQLNTIVKNEKIGIIYSPFNVLLNTSQKNNSLLNFLTNKVKCIPHEAKLIYNNLLKSNFIIFSSVLIRKSVFESTGGFSRNLVHNEDYEILLKSCYNHLAICINEPMVFYRIHDSNNSYVNGEISYIENNYIYNQLPKSPLLIRAIKNNNTRLAIFKIRNRHYLDGLKYLFKHGSLISIFSIFIKRLSLLSNLNLNKYISN